MAYATGRHGSLHSALQELLQCIKIPVVPGTDIGVAFVDQIVSQQKYLHAQCFGNHILIHIVADHDAVGGFTVDLCQDIAVIGGIGLTVAAVFVGGNPFKILRLQAGPTDTTLGGNSGEKGIGSQYNTAAKLFQQINYGFCLRCKTARQLYLLEIGTVKLIE